jgi:hypothetical protein
VGEGFPENKSSDLPTLSPMKVRIIFLEEVFSLLELF